ncbi:MAG: hypothetical protein PHU31_11020 [Anaerotignum sp.]|nr:hypothetical protein [Anaerotignum sp.]
MTMKSKSPFSMKENRMEKGLFIFSRFSWNFENRLCQFFLQLTGEAYKMYLGKRWFILCTSNWLVNFLLVGDKKPGNSAAVAAFFYLAD